MTNTISKWKAIWRIITESEFFLMTASQDNKFTHESLGPIRYKYETNTKRKMFFIFLDEYVKKLIKEDIYMCY